MEVVRVRDTQGTGSRKPDCARTAMTDRERCRQASGRLAVCEWGGLSSVVLGGGESPLPGEGLDGSAQPAKETHAGHCRVGSP